VLILSFNIETKRKFFMQAYKLNATIDESGSLVLDEPLNIAPGKVELIILQALEATSSSTNEKSESPLDRPKRKSRVKAFEGLFENAPYVTPRLLYKNFVLPMPLNEIIQAIANFASPILKDKIQRNETVIKLLQKFQLDPEHPPGDFSGVYAYALVEYGVGKPRQLLEIFRHEEIKQAFRKALDHNNP
jgi:hypothetical protein